MTGFFEATKIVNEIRNLHAEGFKYNDIALLYRINAQSRSLEEAFMHAGIPYVIIGGLKFYDRMEIKNILAYLRLIYNPQDDMSLRRIINVPKRGVGMAAIAKLQDFATSHDVSIFEVVSNDWLLNQVDIFPRVKQNLRYFAGLILKCMELQYTIPIDELIMYVLEGSGYMTELKTDPKPEDESRIENIGEFINVAKEFVNQNAEDSGLNAFLNHISLISDLDVVSEGEDRVSLMTVHSAKGLEFPVVFITGLEEGLFPHSRSLMNEEELEEERRACYVAITRAQQKLYITFATSRSNFGKTINCHNSRFLEEIPREYLDFYEQKTSTRSANTVFVHIAPRKTEEANIKIIKKVNPIARAKANVISINAQKSKTKTQSETNLRRDWQVGDKVKHKKWGEGTVLEIKGMGTEREIKVKFLDNGIGVKSLSLMYAPITKVRD